MSSPAILVLPIKLVELCVKTDAASKTDVTVEICEIQPVIHDVTRRTAVDLARVHHTENDDVTNQSGSH